MNRLMAAMATFIALGSPPPALAQSGPPHPHVRPDTLEMQRQRALSTVQRLRLPPRAQHDPQVQVARPGERGCTFNIGDVRAGQAEDNGADKSRRYGVGRDQYITLVDASPICVTR